MSFLVCCLTMLIWRKKKSCTYISISAILFMIKKLLELWQCKITTTNNCRTPVHRQFSTELTLQLLVHGHVILFYKKGYLNKCNCIYCSGCCQLDNMLEGKVVWDQLKKSLILHSKAFCKFLSLLLFLALRGKLRIM